MKAKCLCRPKLEPRWRGHDTGWNVPFKPIYGYGISLLVHPHTGVCPLADEVLAAKAVRVEAKR